jgi:hypothetical protein
MWKSRTSFCFLMRNVILNKNLLSKQIFSMYSYFLVDPHICIYIQILLRASAVRVMQGDA